MFKKCPLCQARVLIGTGCCPSCLRSLSGASCDPMILHIRGRLATNTEISLSVAAAVAFLPLGVFLLCLSQAAISSGVPSDGSRGASYFVFALFSIILAPFTPSRCEHAYLDFAERQIITFKNYVRYEAFRNCRPLTGLALAGLWIGDAGFADRLHQGVYSQNQDRPTRSPEPAATAQPIIQNRSAHN